MARLHPSGPRSALPVSEKLFWAIRAFPETWRSRVGREWACALQAQVSPCTASASPVPPHTRRGTLADGAPWGTRTETQIVVRAGKEFSVGVRRIQTDQRDSCSGEMQHHACVTAWCGHGWLWLD
jgi:hypothetical protein